MTPLQVHGQRVIVKTEDQSVTERASGLVTVESYAPDVIGTVIACADRLDVVVGDVVIFPPSAGQILIWESERYLVLDPDDIIAVYEPEPEIEGVPV